MLQVLLLLLLLLTRPVLPLLVVSWPAGTGITRATAGDTDVPSSFCFGGAALIAAPAATVGAGIDADAGFGGAESPTASSDTVIAAAPPPPPALPPPPDDAAAPAAPAPSLPATVTVLDASPRLEARKGCTAAVADAPPARVSCLRAITGVPFGVTVGESTKKQECAPDAASVHPSCFLVAAEETAVPRRIPAAASVGNDNGTFAFAFAFALLAVVPDVDASASITSICTPPGTANDFPRDGLSGGAVEDGAAIEEGGAKDNDDVEVEVAEDKDADGV